MFRSTVAWPDRKQHFQPFKLEAYILQVYSIKLYHHIYLGAAVIF